MPDSNGALEAAEGVLLSPVLEGREEDEARSPPDTLAVGVAEAEADESLPARSGSVEVVARGSRRSRS